MRETQQNKNLKFPSVKYLINLIKIIIHNNSAKGLRTLNNLKMKNVSFLGIVLCCTISFVFAGVSDKLESDFFDNPEINLQLSHYFGSGEPTDSAHVPRGTVVIRSFKGPRFNANQKDLTEADLSQIQKLAEEDGYYFIKASIKTSSGEKHFNSFASAKTLLQSGLSDILRVHVNPNGEIIAIGYSLTRSDINTKSTSRKLQQRFNTTVLVHHGELGPQPDTAPYLEKLEHERVSKERGEDPRDNRSFLAKYWMYIVPIAIMVLLSGASGNTEEGGAAR